jgi:type IV pilus assembly protein PilM
MKLSNNKSRALVGLDIEPGYVAAVEARVGGEVAVDRAAAAALAPGVVRDGEVADVEGLAEALRNLFTEHKLPKRVRLGVANQRIVVRTIDLPPLEDDKELAAALKFQAQDHIPMPLDQAVLEHHSLGVVETAEGPRARVVIVAARRDMLERFLGAARQAGLRPEGIDLSAFAMIRALGRGNAVGSATLYASVGGVTNMAVAEGSRCLFTRVVTGGFETLATELAERRGLTLEHAQQWLGHVGLEEPVEVIDGDREIVSEARVVLSDGVRRIADDLRNSLDFYRSQEGAMTVDSAVLTGPACAIDGFTDQLSSELGMPVETGMPVEGRPGALVGLDPSRLAVAAGLAVEEGMS